MPQDEKNGTANSMIGERLARCSLRIRNHRCSWGWRRSRRQHSHLSTGCRQNQATGTTRSPWPARLRERPWSVRTAASSRPVHDFFLRTPDIVKTTLRHDGIRGMYRGLGPTLLGYLPTWAIYFAVYDGIKRHFGEPPLGEPAPSGRIYPAAQPKGYQPVMRDHPWTLHILSAMTAGAASTTCTNPLWVIKTRFMVPRDLIAVIMISCAHAPLPTIRHSPDAK